MKKLIAKKDFTIDDIFFAQDEEVKGMSYEQIVKLNEKGFINPLTRKELKDIKNDLVLNKNRSEEEEK